MRSNSHTAEENMARVSPGVIFLIVLGSVTVASLLFYFLYPLLQGCLERRRAHRDHRDWPRRSHADYSMNRRLISGEV